MFLCTPTFFAGIVFPLTPQQVLRCITPVVGEWYQLGLALGVVESALSVIEYNHQGDVETCKRKMVQMWLKQPHPSWYSLVEALKATGITAAATKIAESFDEGK